MRRGVNAFALRVAVPALVFTLLAEADLGAYRWEVLIAYHAAEIAVLAATFLICRALGCGGWRRPTCSACRRSS